MTAKLTRCTAANLAEDDLARWLADIRATLPGADAVTGIVTVIDRADPESDNYLDQCQLARSQLRHRLLVRRRHEHREPLNPRRSAMKSTRTMRAAARQSGLSMIELLVALAIGSFLIIGAVTLQSQSRRNFDVNEQQARVQENARYVIAVIEPELQLAGVYGYSQDPNAVQWENSGGAPTPPSDLRMDDAAAPGLPESLKVCGDNFAVDVLGTVTAINDDQDVGHGPGLRRRRRRPGRRHRRAHPAPHRARASRPGQLEAPGLQRARGGTHKHAAVREQRPARYRGRRPARSA